MQSIACRLLCPKNRLESMVRTYLIVDTGCIIQRGGNPILQKYKSGVELRTWKPDNKKRYLQAVKVDMTCQAIHTGAKSIMITLFVSGALASKESILERNIWENDRNRHKRGKSCRYSYHKVVWTKFRKLQINYDGEVSSPSI